jgi:Tol biopolymer transport system component
VLRGAVADRFGNARTEAVTWSIVGTGASVTNSGVVTATAVGSFLVTVSSVHGSDSTAVRAVPAIKIVGYQTPGRLVLVTVDVDGSNRRELVPVDDGGIGPAPMWIPGTNRIIYTHFVDPYRRIHTLDEDATIRRVFDPLPPGISHQALPTPSANGQWLYFIAHDVACAREEYCLHRSRMDGTGIEVTLAGSEPLFVRSIGPSPDGSKVAVVVDGAVRVLDVATKMLAPWGFPGVSPRWSPEGSRIAFVQGPEGDGPLLVVNADGTGLRPLTDLTARITAGPISWTSDGEWILVHLPESLALVEVATGTIHPLWNISSIVFATVK